MAAIKIKQVDGLQTELNDIITYVDGEITAPTLSNKGQSPSATSGDGSTTGITITHTPARDSMVSVSVNGVSVSVGDAIKTKFCYFSADGGTTARSISSISAGDTLYWNGVVASYELATSYSIDINYVIADIGTGGNARPWVELLQPTVDLGAEWISTSQTTPADIDLNGLVPANTIGIGMFVVFRKSQNTGVYEQLYVDKKGETVGWYKYRCMNANSFAGTEEPYFWVPVGPDLLLSGYWTAAFTNSGNYAHIFAVILE